MTKIIDSLTSGEIKNLIIPPGRRNGQYEFISKHLLERGFRKDGGCDYIWEPKFDLSSREDNKVERYRFGVYAVRFEFEDDFQIRISEYYKCVVKINIGEVALEMIMPALHIFMDASNTQLLKSSDNSNFFVPWYGYDELATGSSVDRDTFALVHPAHVLVLVHYLMLIINNPNRIHELKVVRDLRQQQLVSAGDKLFYAMAGSDSNVIKKMADDLNKKLAEESFF